MPRPAGPYFSFQRLVIIVALSQELQDHFESIGPAGVKREMAEGKRGAFESPNWLDAETWIQAELIRLDLEADDRRDGREERTLAVTESALNIAKESAIAAQRSAFAAEVQAAASLRQARWAIFAAVVAMVSAIASSESRITNLLYWLKNWLFTL